MNKFHPMRSINSSLLAVIVLLGLVMTSCTTEKSPAPKMDKGIVQRPEQLKFPPLHYDPPSPAQYRVQLKSGPVAYVVPDRDLPLVNIAILVRVGQYLEPMGKEGLAEMTGYLLTRSGTQSKSDAEMQERLAYLAAQMDSKISGTEGTVSLNLLSKDLDEGFGILREMLTAPRFEDDKIDLYKEQSLQDMKQRNDNSEDIESREFGFLARGDNFWVNRYSTEASLKSITRDDIQAFHHKWFHPDDFVVAVNGDFDRDDMIARLEKLFGDWPFAGEKPSPVPTNYETAPAGVYIVNKDVNQGRVSILMPGIVRDNPDYFKIQVMNDILGGGGFTSHIMNSVRSDEGLAYSAYSSCPGGVYYPSIYTAEYQSKSRSVSYAASIVLREMKKMMATPPTDAELAVSKQGYVDRFPHYFATKAQIANTFAEDEFTGRYAKDPEYYQQYRSRIGAVTKDDVLEVAKKYLHPDSAVILIVGQESEISKKLPEHPVTLSDLTSGPIKELPLRDPMTMKPLPLGKTPEK